MNTQQARAAVEAAFAQIAPDIESSELTDDARLRQDLDIDSLDFLRLVQVIADTTGVDTPEEDYRQLATVGGFVGYVASHA
jgi:acyl carrier protein